LPSSNGRPIIGRRANGAISSSGRRPDPSSSRSECSCARCRTCFPFPARETDVGMRHFRAVGGRSPHPCARDLLEDISVSFPETPCLRQSGNPVSP
jgi:hypothetical protein